MNKKVWVPKYLREEIGRLKRGYPASVVPFAYDVETCDGEPYFLIFCDANKHVRTFVVNKDTILDTFLDYVFEHCTSRKNVYVFFSHNLSFDLTAIFASRECEIFAWNQAKYVHYWNPDKTGKVAIFELFSNKSWFAKIYLKQDSESKNSVNVKVVDSASFLRGSLYNLSRQLNLSYTKRERPYFVAQGKMPKNQTEWADLRRYCHDEIRAEHCLAEYILNMHKAYDVTPTVSAAQLSSKVFRRKFLTEPIIQASVFVMRLAEAAIHGGRAGVFVKTPDLFPNVSLYDYNSFYSFSMANLPAFSRGEWKLTQGFDFEHEGFYWIRGYAKACRYPVLIKNITRMDYADSEYVYNAPVTSYELREALRNGEFKPDSIVGYVWFPHPEATNPFKDFAEHFYELKLSEPKDSSLYVLSKLMLNSLYGKTYQAILTSSSQALEDFRINLTGNRVFKVEKEYRAGGIYLPHVGGLITSQCRAILHKDLHRYSGIDCATDSFKTTMSVPTGTELGALKKEAEGLLLLLRPKVYVMFSPERQREILQCGDLAAYLAKEGPTMEVGKDKDIVKFATHGYQGNVHTLLQMIAQNKYTYEARHMVKIGEAIRQHKQPRIMEHQIRTMNVDWQKLSNPYIKAQQYQSIS